MSTANEINDAVFNEIRPRLLGNFGTIYNNICV